MKSSLAFFLLQFTVWAGAIAQNRILVSLQKDLKGPYTGKLFVYTLKDTSQQFSITPSVDEAAFSTEVFNWKYGETIEIPQYANALNVRLPLLSPGYYKLIAILDTNNADRGNWATGNLFTRNEAIMQVVEGKENKVELTLSHAFPARNFPENDSIQEIRLISTQLSRFSGFPVEMKAAVILPPGYKNDPARVYPVVYIIPGWGGTHHNALAAGARKSYGVGIGKEKIYVFLNPESKHSFGLHAFVDSRVNGPWGRAFVEEMMPFIQKKYRTSSNPALNFITGQSTGGYGAVWLALNFPEHFGGCWASAPDPLDFSSFTGVDIYNDENFFTDNNGLERGFNKVKGVFTSTLRKQFTLEAFEGAGGQQQSFEAEFGIAGVNGQPVRLFDGTTGKINHEVARSWRLYDMATWVSSNAGALQKLVKFPVRIFVGSNDNFLLDRSALSFAEKIKAFRLPVYVEEIPGADHFTVRNEAVIHKIQLEMDTLIEATEIKKK